MIKSYEILCSGWTSRT